LWAKTGPPKKCHLSRKKPLRRSGGIRKYPLTETATMPDREKTEADEAGRAKEDRAHSVNFVSPLFEIAGN
jgi:hypothetical protein